MPTRYCHRLAALLLLAVVLAAPAVAQDVTLGPGLEETLRSADPTDELEVIVSFSGDGPLADAQLAALRAAGVTRGVYFQSLPIAGVLATPDVVEALAGLDGVRSVWPNLQLAYENDGATRLTGVDRLRTDAHVRTDDGMPFSGRGVGVLINDSGVDGTHPDHTYPDRVVQNVAGQTNLHALSGLLPYTPTEDVPDTDVGGGHGTHVAGIIGASGAQSGGRYEGVAPGADLIGYGSGAGLFILDTIGGFDYALTHQYEYGIRVVSNSFGSTNDSGTPFDPDDPTNIATKMLADRGIVVVFSAGNSGPGESTITGNFKKAPWVVAVAAGDDHGRLGDFSSRGRAGHGGTVEVDGETYTWVDRPTVTAPGVDIVSTRASTSSLQGLSAEKDAALIPPAYLPYYTTMSGTSMACPHVSGIVALMLEANPQLDVYAVREILQETATNVPGRAPYEVGAGYVNAYAAVVRALERRTDYGSTLTLTYDFNSSVDLSVTEEPFTVAYDPTGVDTRTYTFEVDRPYEQITAHAELHGLEGETGNTVGLALVAPDGTRYTSGVSVLFTLYHGRDVVVDGPMQGTWTVELYGVNGVALPEEADGYVRFKEGSGYVGLDDVDGHPAAGAIRAAVGAHLVDGYQNGTYRPDRVLRRKEMAQYLVFGAAIRQHRPVDGTDAFGDVNDALMPFVEAVAARGAALKDREQDDAGVMLAVDGAFRPNERVERAGLAYALVQGLGLEDVAADHSGDVTVEHGGERLVVEDQDAIPAGLRGYVQLALDLGLLNAYFALEQGPYDLQPTLKATFRPDQDVTRAAYAVAATRFHAKYGQAMPAAGTGGDTEASLTSGTLSVAGQAPVSAEAAPQSFALEANYPNPFNPSTQIAFTLAEETRVSLTVYDVLGRQVRVLLDGRRMAAGAHQVPFEASDLPSGTYLYRIETPSFTDTRSMVLAK